VGLEFAVMWGLLAFLLNYIPTIGSFVAAVPATMLALVTLDWEATLGLSLGYLVINTTLGNFIEPRLMGQSLGLSPLVVFFSLVFWGWLWGPVGMLLCVPLTVIAKLVLESNEDTRWVALLLGSPRDARRQHGAPFVVPRM
ncbi:MAG: AI-2E family transporter, partial [Myxococcota bacterium]